MDIKDQEKNILENIYNRLGFEDEYLNGKRNGKGKEYEHGKVIFECEFLNGKALIQTRYGKNGNI